jgi:thiosulfate dehydrogenase
MNRVIAAAAAVIVLVFGGCNRSGPPALQNVSPKSALPLADLPHGPMRDMVEYGRALVVHTRRHLAPYITANMDCSACHVDAGTKPRGGSFVGIAAQFPQWNKRAQRIISLQDRLAECFLYSMNGHPPAYQSREMEALVAYITYLSRGAKVGSKPDPATQLASIEFAQRPDLRHGQSIYHDTCSKCHGSRGEGTDAHPPLWGPLSFNDGAGMHRLRTMAGFVRYNMPRDAPGTLSDKDAYDVAGYVLSHERPKFKRSRLVTFPPDPANYF